MMRRKKGMPRMEGAWQGIAFAWVLFFFASCTQQVPLMYVPTKEVDVQSMEVGRLDRWPERTIAMTGDVSPCPGAVLAEGQALNSFQEALGETTTILERGAVKEAILDEWRQQMSGIYDDATTSEWGNLSGADGVAMLEVTCREGIQVHAVTVSDAESGHRLFSERYVGGELASAMQLLSMELAARDRIVRHPLDGLSDAQLRDSTFNYFEVDELGALTWRTELEAVMQRALTRYRPANRLNFSEPLEVELDLDPARGASLDFHVSGLRSEMLERHFGDASSGLSLPAVPTFSGIKLHANARVTMPFAFYYDPRFPMRMRMEGAEGPQEVRDALRGAPPGNYEFQYRFWRLGAKEFKDTRLISAQPRSTAGALALSAIAPGMGMEYVTFGQRKGGNWLVAVLLPAALGFTLDALSDQAYADYQSALTPELATSHYNKANQLHQGAVITLGISGVLWGYNLFATHKAADGHRRALRQFIEQ